MTAKGSANSGLPEKSAANGSLSEGSIDVDCRIYHSAILVDLKMHVRSG